jgi:hypothetical protein
MRPFQRPAGNACVSDQSDKLFLQAVVCAAGAAADVGRLIAAAYERHGEGRAPTGLARSP